MSDSNITKRTISQALKELCREISFDKISVADIAAAIDQMDELKQLKDSDKEFDAEFYAFGICGMIISRAQNGMKIPPETVSARLKCLARDREQIVLTPGGEEV